MADRTQVEGAPRARRGLLSRIVGIVVAPGETFADVVAAPKVLGVLLFVMLVGTIAIGGFFFTEVGRKAWLDQAVSSTEAWGGQVNDEQYAGMERMAPFAGYFAIAQMVFGIPLVMLITAGILFVVFNAAMGGRASFKQLFAVVAHSSVISALGWIFVMPLNYFRETMTSPTNLSVLAPNLEEGSFLARLLGTIDLFLIWWVIVLGIGLAVLYRRRTQPIVVTLLAVYAVIAVIIAGAMSALGGS
ncbi:MAG: YIP1 family protein [Vicinamibacterales bacterium]